MNEGFIDLAVPIVQAPMGGGGSTVAMAAAVSNAGGLGSLACGYLRPDAIAHDIEAMRRLTDKPFAVNLFVDEPPSVSPATLARANERLAWIRRELAIEQPSTPPSPLVERDAQIEAVLEARPAVFSFTFGVPAASALRRCKEYGIVTLGTATTVEEALALKEAGVDAVCAQGSEAGAHRGTFLRSPEESLIGTLALVPQIVDAVAVPVIAAGGVGDGRGLAAVLALGAVAAQVGTSFLLASESAISAPYRRALGEFVPHRTTITTTFSGRAARGIVNRFTEEMAQVDEIAPYPYQNALTSDIRAAAAKTGRAEFLSLWAGQAAALAKTLPAAEIVGRFADEASAALERAQRFLAG